MIIDLHAHCNSGSKYDCPETEIDKRSLEFLKTKHNLLGIDAVGISYYSSVLHDKEIFEDNVSLNNLIEEDKQIYQWLVLDPRQEFLYQQIRIMINEPKVHLIL